MNILITGGAGFIGSNFVHYWADEHPRDTIIVLDKLTYAGSISNFSGLNESCFKFIYGDICNTGLVYKIVSKYKISVIVNFAAESHVDRSIADATPFVHSNVHGVQTLLDVARQYWLIENNWRGSTRFHHISTDEVFGDLALGAPPVSEAMNYQPSSPYSASKAAADHLVRAWYRTYGLNTTISICSNNFGPRQHSEKLIPLVISKLLSDQAVPVFGDGEQIRDWISVDDHVRGIDMVLSKGMPGESYNIGVRNEVSNIELIVRIIRLLEAEFICDKSLFARFPEAKAVSEGRAVERIHFVEDRPGHDRRYAIDPSKIENALGFSSVSQFEESLRATVNWYLGQGGSLA